MLDQITAWTVAHPWVVPTVLWILLNVIPRPNLAGLTGWKRALWETADRLCVLSSRSVPGVIKALFATSPEPDPRTTPTVPPAAGVGVLVLAFVCSVSVSCGASLTDAARTAWNAGNATAVTMLERVEEGHSKALDACQDEPCIDTAAKRWHPAYVAFRAYRASLEALRVLLESDTPSAATLAVALANIAMAEKDLTAELGKLP